METRLETANEMVDIYSQSCFVDAAPIHNLGHDHKYEALLHVTDTRCEGLVDEFSNGRLSDNDARPFLKVYQLLIPNNFQCPLKPCGWSCVGGTL